MKIVRITKRLSRKISYDYKSWEFVTEFSADVEINNDEELEQKSKELFIKVLKSTLNDIKLLAKKEERLNEF